MSKGNKKVLIVRILLVVGIVTVVLGLTFVFNVHHKEVVSSRTYVIEEIPAYIFIRYITKDAFMAGNPIDAVIETGIINNVQTLQLTFDGAGSYFPPDFSVTKPEDIEPQDIEKLHESLWKSINNLVPLQRQISSTTGIVKFIGEAGSLAF